MADNNTYSTNIDALSNLVSGRQDNPAPGIAAGEGLSDNHILEAELQHRTRKALRSHGLASPEEVVASKKRKVKVTNENATAVRPAWAQQMLQEMLQQFPRMLRIDRIQAFNASTQQNRASTISLLPRLSDGLYPLDHNVQLWIPNTWEALSGASAAQVTPLLNFYELSTAGNAAAKRLRILRHFCGN